MSILERIRVAIMGHQPAVSDEAWREAMAERRALSVYDPALNRALFEANSQTFRTEMEQALPPYTSMDQRHGGLSMLAGR